MSAPPGTSRVSGKEGVRVGLEEVFVFDGISVRVRIRVNVRARIGLRGRVRVRVLDIWTSPNQATSSSLRRGIIPPCEAPPERGRSDLGLAYLTVQG